MRALRTALAAVLSVALFSGLAVGLAGCQGKVSRYYNTHIVVPNRLLGEVAGQTDADIEFTLYSNSSQDPAAPDFLSGTIPAGTDYLTVEGYPTSRFVALPFGPGYLLFASKDKDRVEFPAGPGDDELYDGLRGTQAQACCEVFSYIAGYKATFFVLYIADLRIDDPASFIALALDYSERRGATLLLADSIFVESQGYLSRDDWEWWFEDGLFLHISNFWQESDEFITMSGSVLVAPLAASGYVYTLILVDGTWVVDDIMMEWIS